MLRQGGLLMDKGFFLVDSKDFGTLTAPILVFVLSGTNPNIRIRRLLGLS